MNSLIFKLVDNINEGIAVLSSQKKILFWNSYMERITEKSKSEVEGKDIFEILPGMNKNYYVKVIDDVLDNGTEMFFSAAMHKDIISLKHKLNFRIIRLELENSYFLMLEFVNVSGKLEQINQLKAYINKLFVANQELKEKEKLIQKLAFYDNLTGVANRTFFYTEAKKLIERVYKENATFALMFVDIDKFKHINDSYGHMEGDRILSKVAYVLQSISGEDNIVARYGGDEFLILFYGLKNDEECIAAIRDIQDRVDETQWGLQENVTLSIGYSLYPRDGDTIDKLMVQADKVMYHHKNKE